MTYDAFMNDVFYICVALLRWGAHHLNMTYEELNIWIFVVIHPLLTLGALLAVVWFWVRTRKLAHAHNLHVQQLRNLENDLIVTKMVMESRG